MERALLVHHASTKFPMLVLLHLSCNFLIAQFCVPPNRPYRVVVVLIKMLDLGSRCLFRAEHNWPISVL